MESYLPNRWNNAFASLFIEFVCWTKSVLQISMRMPNKAWIVEQFEINNLVEDLFMFNVLILNS
jgi:hypothetical protein